MAAIIASPYGITLPYSSIFDVNLRQQSKRQLQSRPSSHFWNRATQPADGSAEEDIDAAPDHDFLDIASPVMSDSEDGPSAKQKKVQDANKKQLRLRIRKIAFKAFTPKSDGTGQKNNIVRTTEIVARQQKINGAKAKESGRFSIFKSWKMKSKSGGTQMQKMVAVVKHRISASSPPEDKPKTWDEFHYLYANEQINVHTPPLPPMDPAKEGETPTVFQSRFFSAPRPPNQAVRMLVLNRLAMFGSKGYDPSPEGAANSVIKIELGDQLMQQGKAPTSLDMPFESRYSISSEHPDVPEVQTQMVPKPLSLPPPESLEQHPVFRRIVQRCRELFQVSIGLLSILDDDRQIFLAESGINSIPKYKGMREIPRDITFCAHTVLSGRKGFTCLDTHKDWRFENGPLAQAFDIRFYAGVPLMAPNLDGSKESEEKSCPIGTLCLLDFKPRESFTSEDRKKLVYLSEYARREIEQWFVKKMDYKISNLAASKETWKQELTRIDTNSTDMMSSAEPEVLSDAQPSVNGASGGFRRASSISTESNSHASHENSIQSPIKMRPGIFEDLNLAVKPNMRRVFDLATKLVAETLDLSLVYLAAAAPHDETSELGRTVIVSGHNVPIPAPFFDTALHLKALKTPEGGLLYQNPSVEECEKDGLQPKSSTSENGKSSSTYASAMLLAVGSGAQSDGGGFILAGYTEDPSRVFGAEDVSYMKQFAHELSRYTSKLRL